MRSGTASGDRSGTYDLGVCRYRKLGEREQIELWRVREAVIDGIFGAVAGELDTEN